MIKTLKLSVQLYKFTYLNSIKKTIMLYSAVINNGYHLKKLKILKNLRIT